MSAAATALSSFFPLGFLTDVRVRLTKLSSYVAGERFLSLVGWKREGMGNILVAKASGEKMVCVVVGEVLDDRLRCGPVGNLIENATYPKPLEAAKYSFMLGRPLDPSFAKDFDQVVRTLKNCEGSVAMTDDRRYLVDVIGHETVLRFSAPCWEKRQDLPDLAPGAALPDIDEDTRNWPVPAAQQARFNDIKYTHRVLPLPVYDVHRHFVDCLNANNKLRDALVEVHFTIKHYGIRREPAFDSFSAIVQQILVLKEAPKKKTNPYRINLKLGPVAIEDLQTPPQSGVVADAVAPITVAPVVPPVLPSVQALPAPVDIANEKVEATGTAQPTAAQYVDLDVMVPVEPGDALKLSSEDTEPVYATSVPDPSPSPAGLNANLHGDNAQGPTLGDSLPPPGVSQILPTTNAFDDVPNQAVSVSVGGVEELSHLAPAAIPSTDEEPVAASLAADAILDDAESLKRKRADTEANLPKRKARVRA